MAEGRRDGEGGQRQEDVEGKPLGGKGDERFLKGGEIPEVFSVSLKRKYSSPAFLRRGRGGRGRPLTSRQEHILSSRVLRGVVNLLSTGGKEGGTASVGGGGKG